MVETSPRGVGWELEEAKGTLLTFQVFKKSLIL